MIDLLHFIRKFGLRFGVAQWRIDQKWNRMLRNQRKAQ